MRFIPTKVHGNLHYLTGVLLIAAPWLLGFADVIFWPHLAVGLFSIGAGLFTHKMPNASTSAL